MKTDAFLERLANAKSALAAAESDLERALAEIQTARRAEKVTVSGVVAAAFDKVRAARTDITSLEDLVMEEKDKGDTAR